jgi:hypothetical protein
MLEVQMCDISVFERFPVPSKGTLFILAMQASNERHCLNFLIPYIYHFSVTYLVRRTRIRETGYKRESLTDILPINVFPYDSSPKNYFLLSIRTWAKWH